MIVGTNQREWTRADFIFSEQLGSGKFGVVYKAISKEFENILAIKVIPKNKITSTTLYKRLQRQIEVHCRLNHCGICRMYGYFSDQKNVYLVLEYCKNGNLHTLIKCQRQKLTDKKIASIFKQLASAVEYLSYRNVMHRDIKLENILLDENYNVKITDFGCCAHSTQQRNTFCGTVEYLCPEMLNQETYGPEVDLYCLGIILYELFYFKSPFFDAQEDQMLANIKQGVIVFEDTLRKVSDSAKQLISSLLLKKQQRPKIQAVLNHIFISQFFPNQQKGHLSEEESRKHENSQLKKESDQSIEQSPQKTNCNEVQQQQQQQRDICDNSIDFQ